MISTGDIWLEQDALVYKSLDSGQCHCPLGRSFTFSAAVQHSNRATCVQRLQLFLQNQHLSHALFA